MFRILGDVSHTLSKCILIFAIHRNSSTEGVSLITQALYCLVFVCRYLDIFFFNTAWNTVLKVFYILSSLYILFLMLRVYARTRERETAWKLGALCLVGSAVFAPIMMMIFAPKVRWGWLEVCATLYLGSCSEHLADRHLLTDILDEFHYPRVCLRPPPTPTSAADHSPYCNRLLLPPDTWLLSRILYPQLDRARTRHYGPQARYCIYHFRCHTNGFLRRLRMGLL